jgi:subtilisin family serine protease/subtilisin-like proprotein convertase family protein
LSFLFFFLSSVSFLTSCVKAPKSSTNSITVDDEPVRTDTASSDTLIDGIPSSTALEGVPYNFTPSTIGSGVIVTGINLPSWASVNPTTGVITGTPSGFGVTNNIRLIATRGSSYSEIGPFSMQVLGDPLYTYQWHLSNTGQSSFSDSGGIAGIDLNVSSVYSDQITGVGVSIAVSDSGLELGHEDLDDNLFTNFHKDYTIDSPFFGDPSPAFQSGDHGTSVAGIIAAEGWNNIGGRGVAPGAVIAGLNYLQSDFRSEVVLDQAQGSYSLFNYSYGSSFVPTSLSWDSTYSDQINFGFINGRQTRGSLYIKSAGNSYAECDYQHSFAYRIENANLCFSHNANMDPENAISNMVIVGALNASGERASYSSTGSNLWISGFGGEYGADKPAIVTIDQPGCNYGYSRSNVASSNSDFQKGEDPLNDDCDYTHTFNGTSSAAPTVSGVIALMLQANPNLTSRDVKYILAKTADTVNDPTFDGSHPFPSGGFFDLAGHTYEQGWVTNGAGFNFHNHFGFGKIDALEAVNMAKTYTSNWPDQVNANKDFDEAALKTTVNSSIPDGSATGVSSFIFVNNSLSIEGIQVMVNITHGRPGDLGIELTGPSGTKSILLNVNNSMLIPLDSSDSPVWVADLSDFVLSSNAFYGENSRGVWTLKVIDALDGATGTEYDDAASQTGTLVDWSINIIGR